MDKIEKLVNQVRAMDNVLELTPDRGDIVVSLGVGEEFLGLLKKYRPEITAFLVVERNAKEGQPERETFVSNWASFVAHKYD